MTLHSFQPSNQVSLAIPPLISLISLPTDDSESEVTLVGITASHSILFIRATISPTSPTLSLTADSSLPLVNPPALIVSVDPMGWSRAFRQSRDTSEHDILLTVSEEGELAFWTFNRTGDHINWKCTSKVRTGRKGIRTAACSSAKKTVLSGYPAFKHLILIEEVPQLFPETRDKSSPYGILWSLSLRQVWSSGNCLSV